MSRPMLFATLAVLVAILVGTSYALSKQTIDPKKEVKQEREEISPEKQAAMRKMYEQRQIDQKKTMQEQMKKQQEIEEKRKARLAAAGIKRNASQGVDISDKWFKESADGTAGIQKAIREKEIIDKINSSMPALNTKPVPATPVNP